MATESFKKEWFKMEPEANKFAELVGGKVYDADFIGGLEVQYSSDRILKRYVLEEFRSGIGSNEVFTSSDEAIYSAQKKWISLSQDEKSSYMADPEGIFGVYQIEIGSDNLAEYLHGAAPFNLKEFKTCYLWAGIAKTQGLNDFKPKPNTKFIENAGASFLVLGRMPKESPTKEDLLLLRMSDHQAVIANGWDEKTNSWDFGHYYGNTLDSLSKAISDFTVSHNKTFSILEDVLTSGKLEVELDVHDEEIEL